MEPLATVGELEALCDRIWPPSWAEPWDNVGLLVGSRGATVHQCLCALDADAVTIAEAASSGAQFLLTHHPLPFRPLQRVLADDPTGAAVLTAAASGVAVYSAHTNLDVHPEGVNRALASALGLGAAVPLRETRHQVLYKLVTFVPQGAEEKVLEALGTAGAGRLGNYSHCSFTTPGTGAFRPLPGARPYVGQVGELERTAEVRVEMLVPEETRAAVVQALLGAHPYEEVAYDLIRLENRGVSRGLGLVGTTARAARLGAFAAGVARRLGSPATRYVGDPQKVIRRVAVCGGAGADLVSAAVEAGADVLVTADLRYHEARAAEARGLALVDPGHQATEALVLPSVAESLRAALIATQLDVSVAIQPPRPDVWRPAAASR